MKIALPVESNTIQTEICPSFGRAPYFMVYDTDNNTSVFITNTAATSPGGAGIKAAQMIVDSGAKIAIVPRLGENAANVLKAAGIEIYKASGNGIVENINLLKSRNLSLLVNIHPGFHGKQR